MSSSFHQPRKFRAVREVGFRVGSGSSDDDDDDDGLWSVVSKSCVWVLVSFGWEKAQVLPALISLDKERIPSGHMSSTPSGY